MADSFITVPPDSTGKSLDTRTAPDGNHREVVVIGDPATADVALVDAANGVDVDVTRSALPTGASTFAEQQAQTTHLGTIAGDTTAIETAVQIMDDWDETNRAAVNTIAGQVGVQGGSGAINALTQRVVLATDQPTVPVSLAAGGSTQYAEDTAHVSGDLVTMAGVVQQTADAALSSDGDRSALQVDATGWAKVNVKGSALPAGAATAALQTQPGVDIGDVTVNNGSGAAAVNVQDGGNTLTVDGAVTANAGTNLNTAALALEAGGNLAAAAASLSVIDDWDETDRAKVNPIVGIAGVAAGSGASSTATQRVIAATDSPEVTALQIMDDWDESDRAKVNPIAGQAGVQGASGTVTALTQRVVLATDVALPAGTNAIGKLAANSGVDIGDVDVTSMPVVEIVGDVAADAAVPTNPVIVGGRASTAQPTPVSADGDSVNMWVNRKGSPIVAAAPHVGLLNDPWALTSVTAQYTTTQTSTVLLAGGASERIVVTKIGIQAGATTAATVQVYFGTGAYSRGTSLAIFDGEFAPSATLKPGVRDTGPFISAANGDDVLVTTSAGITLTVTIWYYIIT